MTNKAKKQINEVIYLSPPQEWLYKCDCPKCISGAHFDKEIAESYRKRGELNNEVARLRELFENLDEYTQHDRLCPISSSMFAVCECGLKELREELTTTPEEPVIQENRITEPDPVPTQNEYRELGPDEVICEGDEFQEKQYDPIKNKWYTIYECSMVGKKVSDSDWGRFRTRRPLPTTNCKQISSKLVVEPKQEEKITFEDELSVIFNCDQHSVVEARYATVGAFRYLRDEIQELKQK